MKPRYCRDGHGGVVDRDNGGCHDSAHGSDGGGSGVDRVVVVVVLIVWWWWW